MIQAARSCKGLKHVSCSTLTHVSANSAAIADFRGSLSTKRDFIHASQFRLISAPEILLLSAPYFRSIYGRCFESIVHLTALVSSEFRYNTASSFLLVHGLVSYVNVLTSSHSLTNTFNLPSRQRSRASQKWKVPNSRKQSLLQATKICTISGILETSKLCSKWRLRLCFRKLFRKPIINTCGR